MNETDIKDNKDKEKPGTFMFSLLCDLIIALAIAAVILFFVRPTIVKQSSMENTLKENDYVIMYKQAYRSTLPERGDIIIFQSSLEDLNTGQGKLLIKRVIGLPGDAISIRDNQLYINGLHYAEDYLKDGYTPAETNPPEGGTFIVPDYQYFVMGDNRAGSIDSRSNDVGCVSLDQIRGKAVLRLFPFNKISWL